MDFWKKALHRKGTLIDDFELFVPSTYKYKTATTLFLKYGSTGNLSTQVDAKTPTNKMIDSQ